MLGRRRNEQARQADREVERAEAVLTDLFGFDDGAASAALRDEAATTGVSVQAAALAVIANQATRAPVLSRIPTQR